MSTLPRHRTPGERRAQQSAQAAIARAQARATPPPAPDPTDPWAGAWPPSPAAWRTRCRQIRQEAEENRHG
ncbi:hypothetical protein ACFFMR_18985 [Micromonospora andamanensis]|uniref:Uncharacterized protein n=1 Tax=Micromonospora andamanensis TaxID=1287068 RepID=A0ABQ4HYJ6_9ACTN|nr:hypothetical protein [Micromonospora andamanensis]GIJ10753.1 hypothetical protein Van01_39670 [Micromonospora andamanensis]